MKISSLFFKEVAQYCSLQIQKGYDPPPFLTLAPQVNIPNEIYWIHASTKANSPSLF